VGTLSAGWVVPVIALLYTISTHRHHIYLLSYSHYTSSESALLLSFLQLFSKAYIFFLLMHDTSTREVIPSPFNSGISLVEQKEVSKGKTTSEIMLCINKYTSGNCPRRPKTFNKTYVHAIIIISL
jgi:hypothetical protein